LYSWVDIGADTHHPQHRAYLIVGHPVPVGQVRRGLKNVNINILTKVLFNQRISIGFGYFLGEQFIQVGGNIGFNTEQRRGMHLSGHVRVTPEGREPFIL